MRGAPTRCLSRPLVRQRLEVPYADFIGRKLKRGDSSGFDGVREKGKRFLFRGSLGAGCSSVYRVSVGGALHIGVTVLHR